MRPSNSASGTTNVVAAPIGDKDLRGEGKLVKAAQAIETALDRVIATPSGRTPDMGGQLGTDAFAKRVAEAAG